jgi:hypothetical protein
MEILQLQCSRPYCLANISQLNYSATSSELPLQNSTLKSSQSQSYITTDGQPASLSWNKAPIWGLRPDLDHCLDSCGFVGLGRPL